VGYPNRPHCALSLSGVAIILWSGDAALRATSLAATLLALIVLAELTLHADH
jgi:hypothetical protein